MAEPAGFDLFFSDHGRRDYRALDLISVLRVDEALELLLEDPTEQNPRVRNLSGGTADAVYEFRHSGVTVYYRLVNALVAEIIALIPLEFDSD